MLYSWINLIYAKVWEAQINEYLKGEGIPPIKILYGNKIYTKTAIHNPSDASIIIMCVD